MYDAAASQRLENKLGYELWFLDFLCTKEEVFDLGQPSSTIRLSNKSSAAAVEIQLFGSLHRESVDAFRPLAFSVAFKVLDAIHEWILEENQLGGVIPNVPWRFAQKVAVFKAQPIQGPDLFRNHSFLGDYAFALYETLLPFRNEVIHNHRFQVSGDTLRITAATGTGTQTLDITQVALGSLALVSLTIARMLLSAVAADEPRLRLIKYHLDQIVQLHGKAAFGQQRPLLTNVVLTVDLDESGLFKVALDRVREAVSRTHHDADLWFNLTVVGSVGEKTTATWRFPAVQVPNTPMLELRVGEYEEYRVRS